MERSTGTEEYTEMNGKLFEICIGSLCKKEEILKEAK